MSAWLQRQRKSDLIKIADDAGFKDYESLRKDELALTLDSYLRDNSTRLSKKQSLAEFYGRSGSPVKKELRGSNSTQVLSLESQSKSVLLARKNRRLTRTKDELESTEDDSPTISALATRTPRALQRVAERIPLPPSPAVVADAIDRQTAIVRRQVGDVWQKSGVVESVEHVRELLSSVVGVDSFFLLLEAWGLQKNFLPWRYAFDFPALELVGTPSISVSLPDFFRLLSGTFWSASSLWVTTSVLVPLVVAFFFNLSLLSHSRGSQHRSTTARSKIHHKLSVDPLTYNVAKALVTWLVYGQGVRLFSFFSDSTVARVDAALPGGHYGVLVGAGVGALASLYEAVLQN